MERKNIGLLLCKGGAASCYKFYAGAISAPKQRRPLWRSVFPPWLSKRSECLKMKQGSCSIGHFSCVDCLLTEAFHQPLAVLCHHSWLGFHSGDRQRCGWSKCLYLDAAICVDSVRPKSSHLNVWLHVPHEITLATSYIGKTLPMASLSLEIGIERSLLLEWYRRTKQK